MNGRRRLGERATALAGVALLAVLTAACSGGRSGERVQFEKLRTADRIEVRLDSGEPPLRTISDPATITALVQIAEAHADDWGVPWYGPPVERLRADFFTGERFLNNLGVGADWLGTQHRGYFYSRGVDDDVRAEILRLLDVPDPYTAD